MLRNLRQMLPKWASSPKVPSPTQLSPSAAPVLLDPLVALLGDGHGPQALRAVRYEVADIAQAADWYARLFGTQPLAATPSSAVFDLGGDELVLVQSGESAPARGLVVYWSVEDLTAACERLQRLGFPLADPPRQRDAMTRTACVADPFGNIVGLMERDDPLVRRARSQRTAERVALRNVRGTLDDLLHEEEKQKHAARWVAKALIVVLAVGVLILWVMVGGSR